METRRVSLGYQRQLEGRVRPGDEAVIGLAAGIGHHQVEEVEAPGGDDLQVVGFERVVRLENDHPGQRGAGADLRGGELHARAVGCLQRGDLLAGLEADAGQPAGLHDHLIDHAVDERLHQAGVQEPALAGGAHGGTRIVGGGPLAGGRDPPRALSALVVDVEEGARRRHVDRNLDDGRCGGGVGDAPGGYGVVADRLGQQRRRRLARDLGRALRRPEAELGERSPMRQLAPRDGEGGQADGTGAAEPEEAARCHRYTRCHS